MEHVGQRSDQEQLSPIKLDDFRILAKARLKREVYDYIECGACDEVTQRSNRNDLDAMSLLPLCMRNVSKVDMATEMLGLKFPYPIGFSPTAFHRLVHETGEVATASAARFLNVPMVVSVMSSIALEEIVESSDHKNLWLQTYIFKDREITKELAQRAEQAGYKALFVSAGCPAAGKRDRNIANRFVLPDSISAANFVRTSTLNYNNPIHSFDKAELDSSLTWKDIEWLKATTNLPVVIKGIMNPLDVTPALELELAGIVVSNHGGRQLDTSASTISVLSSISEAASGRVPLFVDSGFRRGTDVLKALALGADCVLLGSPVMWALAVNGQTSVQEAVELLVEETRLAFQMIGCSSIIELRQNASRIIRKATRFSP